MSAANSFLVVPMGLKAGVVLLMALLILNSGITDAVRQRTEDVKRVSNALSTHPVEKHLLRNDISVKPSAAASSSSNSSSSSSSSVVAGAGAGAVLIGSSAPDCAHTCGACSPCTVQVVSFECSSSSSASSPDLHAEACPLGYLCVCHGRAFPIP